MKTYKTTIKSFRIVREPSSIIKRKIINSKDAYEYTKQFFFDDIDIYESFFVILLNRANNTIGFAKISQGGTYGTVVDIKIVAKYCIESLAYSVILCHNHPSGTLEPSKEDINITKRINETLSLFDCKTMDHIIVSSEGYYSLADEGKL